MVFDDLVQGRENPRTGHRGLSGEQVLRMLIVKQMTGSHCDQLSFHLGDGASYRAFCRLGIYPNPPPASPLKRTLERVRAENAKERGVEEGGLVSTACVTDTHIPEPSDASLPWDCVCV